MPTLTGPRAAPKSGTTKSLVILLHGYGADGNDLFGLAGPLSQHLPDTAFRSPKFGHTLILAVESANRLGHGEVTDEHLLLALLREPDSFVTKMLAEKGVSIDWVRDRVTRDAAI